MTKIIIAPHPDDEWIGCGCTLLKAADQGEKVKILLITKSKQRHPSYPRLHVSRQLAKKHGFTIKHFGAWEKEIDAEKLTAFLRKEIKASSTVYLPDRDLHPDHRKINKTAKRALSDRQVELIEYCVYNCSKNPVLRLIHKIKHAITGKGRPSFREGKRGKVFTYKLEEKNHYIQRQYYETARGGDRLRCA